MWPHTYADARGSLALVVAAATIALECSSG